MKPSPIYLFFVYILGYITLLSGQEPNSPIIEKPLLSDTLAVRERLKQPIEEQLEKIRAVQDSLAQLPPSGNTIGSNMPIFSPRIDKLAPMPVAPVDTTINYRMPIAKTGDSKAPKEKEKE